MTSPKSMGPAVGKGRLELPSRAEAAVHGGSFFIREVSTLLKAFELIESSPLRLTMIISLT